MRNVTMATLLAGSVLALVGCSTPNSPALDQARSAVSAARANPDVMSYARTELDSAEEALSRGERALTEEEDLEEADTLAYVATRRAATAEQLAAARADNQAIEGSGEARERAIRMTLEQ
ncbi:MAG TPA: DUF4398 domain-containing protein, partial [Geminicoccus sp.]|uniref:DUF4398 domain-containing protein n=1 Tax=Geminicoccus sp. TaxID=2024832 RepID=UPI002E368646